MVILKAVVFLIFNLLKPNYCRSVFRLLDKLVVPNKLDIECINAFAASTLAPQRLSQVLTHHCR